MKKLLALFSFLLLLQTSLMAATPYNLESMKALNILILDQNDILSTAAEKQLKIALQKKLAKYGIKGEKDGVGAMFVKINATVKGNITIAFITLGVGEESIVKRGDKEVPTFALTYNYEDMIESLNPETDVYDSVINFLIDEFLEQFQEDNES